MVARSVFSCRRKMVIESRARRMPIMPMLSPDQQSGIHCPIICAIQLLTPKNSDRSWRRTCSPDILSVSALEVLRNRAVQIDIYLRTRREFKMRGVVTMAHGQRPYLRVSPQEVVDPPPIRRFGYHSGKTFVTEVSVSTERRTQNRWMNRRSNIYEH